MIYQFNINDVVRFLDLNNAASSISLLIVSLKGLSKILPEKLFTISPTSKTNSYRFSAK